MTTPTSRLLDLGGGRPTIEVLEAGSGAPLLYLHGANGIPLWEGALERLARDFHVHAPLLPGYGRSTGLEHLDDALDLTLHAFDVQEALRLDRPYVVGDSMGGWLAAEMAALRPREVGRLALAAPAGVWRDDAPIPDMFGMMGHELVPYLFHDPECPLARLMRGTQALLSDKDDRTEAQVEMLIGIARGARTAAKFLFPLPDTGVAKRLPRITAPTLILWGAEDRFLSPRYADVFRAGIPRAQLVVVPDAGHMIAAEQPDAYVRAVTAWGHGESPA